jgi:adenine-specific DNA-methyltransferase
LKDGEFAKIERGEFASLGKAEDGSLLVDSNDANYVLAVPGSQWRIPSHDATQYGSRLVGNILPDRSFPFPKSVYAVRDTISFFVANKPNAIVVDFFAGSGTTLNAVHLLNAVDGGHRRCLMVTNNEVAAEEAERLVLAGLQPDDVEWASRGIARSVTWPRSKYTLLGRRDDGSLLVGDYQTTKLVEIEKRRTFRHAAFVTPADFRFQPGLSAADFKKAEKAVEKKKLAFVGMIDALPQNSVTPGCRFIVSEDHKAAVLFDPEATAEWLEALEEQDHITDFYIVAEDDKQFKAIKAEVDDLLGPLIVQEEEKRPMALGFAANVAYFKLDFLDKDRVELGAAFREILPLLWMKAGAIGPAPTLPDGPLPDFFIPEGSPFAVLLNETRVAAFQQALQWRQHLRHIFIVTDAEEAFRALCADLRGTLAEHSPDAEFVQLYRDYLVNFTINMRADSAALGQGGAA